MNCLMARSAKSYQVFFPIITEQTPRLYVMDLKIY